MKRAISHARKIVRAALGPRPQLKFGRNPRPDRNAVINTLGKCLIGLAPWAFLLAVYLRTLAPTVTSEDSGELLTAAFTFGVPHPPGFPLYCLIVGTLMRILPFVSSAWVGNLSSALFAVFAAFVVAATLRRLGVRRSIATGVAISLGLGQTFWSQAVVAEVYSLNALLLASAIYAAVRWVQAKPSSSPNASDRWLLLFALFVGLGLANHYPLTMLALPGLVLYLLTRDLWPPPQQHAHPPLLRRPKILLLSATITLSALILYAYLPLAASRHPAIAWGEPTSLEAFWAHVSRRAYRSLELTDDVPWRDKFAFFADFARLWANEQTPWTLLLGVVLGLRWIADQRRNIGVGVLIAGILLFNPLVLLYLLHFRHEAEHIMRVNEYYLPAYVATALLCGLGFEWTHQRLPRTWLRHPNILSVAWALGLSFGPLVRHFHENDRSQDYLAYDFNRAILQSLEPNALYFPSGDYAAFPALYLQAVEGLRPDVILGSITGEISPATRAYFASLRSARPSNASTSANDMATIQRILIEDGSRPVFFAAKSDVRWNAHLEPWGLVYRASSPGYAQTSHTAPPKVIEGEILRNARPEFGGLVVEDLDRSIRADVLRMQGEQQWLEGDLQAARISFKAAEDWLSNSKEGLNNLGSTLAEYRAYDEAIRLFRRAAALSPNYQTPRRNLAQLEQQMKQEAATPQTQTNVGPPINALAEEVRRQPNHAPTWNNYGSALAETGRFEDARRAFERAIAIDPNYALPHKNLALLLRTSLNDPEAAERHRRAFEQLAHAHHP